jgi:hypothetical protein
MLHPSVDADDRDSAAVSHSADRRAAPASTPVGSMRDVDADIRTCPARMMSRLAVVDSEPDRR